MLFFFIGLSKDLTMPLFTAQPTFIYVRDPIPKDTVIQRADGLIPLSSRFHPGLKKFEIPLCDDHPHPLWIQTTFQTLTRTTWIKRRRSALHAASLFNVSFVLSIALTCPVQRAAARFFVDKGILATLVLFSSKQA